MDTTGSELFFSDYYWSDEMQAPITQALQLPENGDTVQMNAPQVETTMIEENDYERNVFVPSVALPTREHQTRTPSYREQPTTVKPFLTVHRREMQQGLPFYHSIRTNTSSIFVVGFIGTLEQAVEMGNRLIQVVFTEREFKERLKFVCPSELLVLIRIPSANEEATFRFAYDTEDARPHFQEYPSQGFVSRWGVVWNIPLIAVQTSLRNVGGSRDIRVEAVTARHSRANTIQITRAEAEVKLDVQLSLVKKKEKGVRKKRKCIRGCKSSKGRTKPLSPVISPIDARQENDLEGGVTSRYIDAYFHGQSYPEASDYNLVRKYRTNPASPSFSGEPDTSNASLSL